MLSCMSSCLNTNSANFYSRGVGPVPRYAFLITIMRLVTCKNLQGYNQSSEYIASEMLVRLPSAVTYAWFSRAYQGGKLLYSSYYFSFCLSSYYPLC